MKIDHLFNYFIFFIKAIYNVYNLEEQEFLYHWKNKSKPCTQFFKNFRVENSMKNWRILLCNFYLTTPSSLPSQDNHIYFLEILLRKLFIHILSIIIYLIIQPCTTIVLLLTYLFLTKKVMSIYWKGSRIHTSSRKCEKPITAQFNVAY